MPKWSSGGTGSPIRLHYHACDVRIWANLRAIFESVGRVDYVFANAGITESDGVDFFADNVDDAGKLAEPDWKSIFEINVFGVLNAVKLAVSSMRKQNTTAYAAEQNLTIYVTSKRALLGLIRALRSKLPSATAKTMMGASDNDGGDVDITSNGVAPAATTTGMLSPEFASPILAQGCPSAAPTSSD
ncbi:Short-chain dehydrogenase/reductase ATR7 [Apiospora saccharicola]